MSTATLPLTTGPRTATVSQVHRTDRAGRSWHVPDVAVVALASAAVLVPWIAYLARSLPTSYLLTGWSAAWVGFDVLLMAVLAATGLLARGRNLLWPSAAFASAALLVADAWFDVMTAGSAGLLVPVLSAALLELPLATLLVRSAVRATQSAAGTADGPVADAPAPREGAAVEG